MHWAVNVFVLCLQNVRASKCQSEARTRHRSLFDRNKSVWLHLHACYLKRRAWPVLGAGWSVSCQPHRERFVHTTWKGKRTLIALSVSSRTEWLRMIHLDLNFVPRSKGFCRYAGIATKLPIVRLAGIPYQNCQCFLKLSIQLGLILVGGTCIDCTDRILKTH